MTICFEEELTVKSIERYNKDLYLVTFEDKVGQYGFNAESLKNMRSVYLDRVIQSIE